MRWHENAWKFAHNSSNLFSKQKRHQHRIIAKKCRRAIAFHMDASQLWNGWRDVWKSYAPIFRCTNRMIAFAIWIVIKKKPKRCNSVELMANHKLLLSIIIVVVVVRLLWQRRRHRTHFSECARVCISFVSVVFFAYSCKITHKIMEMERFQPTSFQYALQ